MTALLLGDPSPSLRWRAAVELEGAAADGGGDEEVAAWRSAIGSSTEVRTALAHLAATVAANDPKATGYALCRLAHLGYDGPELGPAVESIFATQQDDGSWPHLSVEPEDGPASGGRRRSGGRGGAAPTDAFSAEPYSVVTMTTLVPLRGVAAAGFATDPRAERAYEWLLGQRLDDGSWVGSHRGGYGLDFRKAGGYSETPEYRRLTRGHGCRSATTGAVACLVLHPERCRSDAARIGVDHLLARETRDAATLGWEVSRLVGLEPATGRFTFYATFDHAFLLDLASRSGVSPEDRRVRALVAFLEELRGPYGLWEHPVHPQLSRWLSFDIECSLRRLVDGDWIGDETPSTFTPYRARRRRY